MRKVLKLPWTTFLRIELSTHKSRFMYQTDVMTPKHNVKYLTASRAEGTAVLTQSASHMNVLTPSSSVKNTKTKTSNIQYG